MRLGLLLGVFLPAFVVAQEASESAVPDTFTPAQLQSYFAQGPLAEARRAYVRGQYRQVEELLGRNESPPARFLKAMSLVRRGLHADAGRALTLLAADWPDLRDRLSFEAGKALARARLWPEARQALATVDDDSLVFARARFELERVLLTQRDTPAAIEALTPLVMGDYGTATLFERSQAALEVARLERQRGKPERAKEVLMQAWASMPTSVAARTAARTYDMRRAPAAIRLQRAESLLSDHRNREALAMLSSIKEPEVVCQMMVLQGIALRKERRHTEAIATLTQGLAHCDAAHRLRPVALYTLVSSQLIIEPNRAVDTAGVLADEHPTHPLHDDALMAVARYLSANDREREALAVLTRIAEQAPDGDQLADALFLRFWLVRESEAPAKALAVLDELERLPDGKYLGDPLRRARYWRGRTFEDMGRTLEASALFAGLASESIGSYYGLLARSRLSPEQRVVPQASVDADFAIEAPGLRGQRHFRAGVALMRLQEPGGPAELFAIDRAALDEASLRLLFHVYATNGFDSYAGVVARAYLRRGFSAQASAQRLYQTAYPLEFRELISRHSKRAGVDPELMQALIREESGFQPGARSSTGALGLAQLMPATAFRVGRSLNTWVSRRALLQPGANVRLGSAYLGWLHRHFKGNRFHAIASYNAGENRVARWVKEFGEGPTDEWVEQIPIDETREYVKKVLGSYAAYETLTSRPKGR
jgi:soluble lytic murein transglycosylase